MNPKISKILKKLQKELDAERYQHTLGVMYTAASLAMCHGEDIEHALIAGALHDCAKCIPGREKIKLCKKYNLEVTPVEEKNPSLLHAKLGAYLAMKKYDIVDQDILNAIKSHTTGRPEMTLLEKIIYIADYMEPGRTELPNMAEVRTLAFKNIDDCLYRILEDSLVYLKSRDLPIDIMTEKSYNYYKQELGK
ncbi:MAG: bis(5'-nucleosyl)-tetraphosphatase (symmetrical) YqeK [Lachnospiraceae bacterium]